jgi:hypothetical protein
MPLPDFTSPHTFPPFTALPLTTDDPPKEEEYYLLAQISQNMTLTKPTLILSDTTNTTFALVFDSRPGSGPETLDFAKLGYKKGATLVVPRARRTPPKDAEGENGGGGQKQGFVAVGREREGDVGVIPGGLGKVVEVGGWLRGRDTERGQGEGNGKGKGKTEGKTEGKGRCESCGSLIKKDGGERLMKCTGCGEVGYCSKVSSLLHTVGADDRRERWLTEVVDDAGVSAQGVEGGRA